MKAEGLKCWRCEAGLDDIMLPMSRFAECPQCRADLHVCRLCRFYDPKMIGRCTHDRAEPTEIKDKANFCGHFRPTREPILPGAGAAASEDAKKALDALFDAPATSSEPPPTPWELPPAAPVHTQASRQALDELFGLDGPHSDQDSGPGPRPESDSCPESDPREE